MVNNQSGVGRDVVSADEAAAVHERFFALLEERGITITTASYCPHAPSQGCDCRKPSPGLIQRAAAELGVDSRRCVVVGDSATDVEAGRRAGCRTVLLALDSGAAPPQEDVDAVAVSWPEATAKILELAGISGE